MAQEDDIKYMQRCLDLAIKAEGLTYPNPMVGSVIVCEGRIIGEGYHLKAGGPHAEVNAINSVSDRSLLKKSTIYVNLEPCSHYGKTPPCADLIVSSGIRRVVIGAVDTSEKVAGKGIERLKAAGCSVQTGILENECRYLNRRFFTAVEKKRPYVILKWAQSADGFIDRIRSGRPEDKPEWITGSAEKVLVHKWRSSEQAILAGGGTIRADNPQLNVREWSGNQPLRVVLTRTGSIGQNRAFSGTIGTYLVFTCNMNCDFPDEVKIRLEDGIPAAEQVIKQLWSRNICSLFIEGGREVLNHFISEGVWDEARVFTGNQFFREGVKAPELKGTRHLKQITCSNSLLDIYEHDFSIS
jgi:diaminohydroxyphosphoribosylaminopyrimidine deaminase/5-amino-6-(5-phosphoribosylamino)uracil reductase